MPKKAVFTLLISIAAHVAAVVALDHQDAEPRTIAMGAVQAPVSLSFSTVSQPKPPVVREEAKPEPRPEPKIVKEPVAKAKPVLEKKKEPKPEPVKKKPKNVVKKIEPVQQKKKEMPEPAMERTVTKASHSPGLSDEPVMVTEPEIRNWVEPRYPKLAQRRNQQGVVMLDVIVDERGHPTTVDILESSGYPALDKAAIDAVRRWSFKPEQRNSRFVKSRVHIPVAFQIS